MIPSPSMTNVVGKPWLAWKASWSLSSPRSWRYGIRFSRTKSWISWGSPESKTTPMTSTPFPWFLRQNSAKSACSLRHGPHQVAQKSRTTTLPLSAARLTLPPARSDRSNDGADRTSITGCLQPPRPTATPSAISAPTCPTRIQPLYPLVLRGLCASLCGLCVEELSNTRQRGEHAREPGGEQGQAVGQQQEPHSDEEGAGDVLHGLHVPLDAAGRGEEAVDREAGHDERDAEAQRVRGQEADPLGHGVLLRRVQQDGPEDGADARRPAERERQPHQVGAEEAERPALHGRALLVEEPLDGQDPRRVEAEDDDDHAADHAQLALVRLERRPHESGRGAERDEDRREAEDEDEAGEADPGGEPAGGLRPAQLGHVHAADEGEVAGHDGEHAGGDEGNEARGRRREEADRVIHDSNAACRP